MSRIESGKSIRTNISWKNSLVRFVATNSTALIPLRSDCERRTEGMKKAEELVSDDYVLLVAANHFGRRDSVQILKDVVFRDPILKKKPVLYPIALHQNPEILETPQRMFNVTLAPLVTKSTMDLPEEKRRALVLKNKDGIYKNKVDGPMELNDGSEEFKNKAVAISKKGGVIIVFPQGTEREKLGAPDRPTMYALTSALQTAGIKKIAVLYVSAGIEGAPDYKKERINSKMHLLFDRYKVIIGSCFTLQEILADPEVNGRLRKIDWFSFGKLRDIVLPNYK